MMWKLWLTIAATVAVLVVISVALLIRKNKQASWNGPILTLTSTLTALGIIFGYDRLLGY